MHMHGKLSGPGGFKHPKWLSSARHPFFAYSPSRLDHQIPACWQQSSSLLLDQVGCRQDSQVSRVTRYQCNSFEHSLASPRQGFVLGLLTLPITTANNKYHPSSRPISFSLYISFMTKNIFKRSFSLLRSNSSHVSSVLFLLFAMIVVWGGIILNWRHPVIPLIEEMEAIAPGVSTFLGGWD